MNKSLVALGLALGTALVAAPASAITVTFAPSSQHVLIGDTVTVDVSISGLGAEVLSAFDVNLKYSAGVLGNDDVSHDATAQWGGAGNSVLDVSFAAGDTDVFDYSLLDDNALIALPQSDAFKILTFSFTALDNGVSLVNFGANLNFERNFVGLNFATLNVNVVGACISVGTGNCDIAPIPEPSTYAFMSVGLAALGLYARRRRAAERAA